MSSQVAFPALPPYSVLWSAGRVRRLMRSGRPRRDLRRGPGWKGKATLPAPSSRPLAHDGASPGSVPSSEWIQMLLKALNTNRTFSQTMKRYWMPTSNSLYIGSQEHVLLCWGWATVRGGLAATFPLTLLYSSWLAIGSSFSPVLSLFSFSTSLVFKLSRWFHSWVKCPIKCFYEKKKKKVDIEVLVLLLMPWEWGSDPPSRPSSPACHRASRSRTHIHIPGWGNTAIAQVPTGLFFTFDRSYREFIFKEKKWKGFLNF